MFDPIALARSLEAAANGQALSLEETQLFTPAEIAEVSQIIELTDGSDCETIGCTDPHYYIMD